MELLEGAAKGEEPLGTDPESGKPIYVKNGRFGPYIQLGENDDKDKRNASILKTISPDEVNLEVALKLLSLPRNLGVHPEHNEPVIARDGRFGPYIQCGSETRSLSGGLSPIEVTFEQALELLAQPKAVGRGRAAAAKKEPIKTLETSPVTGNAIQVLDGRYGPYVTDGETNASVPKDMNAAELTQTQALDLLAARAAMGGGKKKKSAKKGTKKAASGEAAAAKKKAAKKAPAKKKAPKKKSS